MLLGLALTAASFVCGAPLAQAQVDRPPQFVELAFDGSLAIPMWQATRDFARRSKLQSTPVNFTYFISGVYYVEKVKRTKYVEPLKGAGASAIGWGGDAADILARYDQTNMAYDEKNEIASHANAHFGGARWSLQNWRDEFRQFHKIIFDFFNFNGVQPTPKFPSGWRFGERQMVGFRAPLLETSAGLWTTLKEYGYRYDTSKTSQPNYWPARDANSGTWNFPLASLVIAGTGKRTLSMDYNFYVADSRALPNPAEKARYKRQMVETYLQYFENNYNGNRAPVHIGHHFSLWNGGAYWEAMQEFASKVCGRPEVKCVTYTELADFMDTRTPAQLRGYQAGNFPKLPPVRIAMGEPTLDVDIRMASIEPGVRGNASNATTYGLQVVGRDALAPGDQIEVRANGHLMGFNGDGLINADHLRRLFKGQNIAIESRILRDGVEIARATQKVSNVGDETEVIATESLEEHALLGDMPEAHLDELGPENAD